MNSSTHVSKYLDSIGLCTKVVRVVDGNSIDKEVHEYKPDVVIIEALWVSGEKLKELIEIKRYSHIRWIVRVHSDIGFLAAETLALKYINDYISLNKHNLVIAPNNKEFNEYLTNAMNFKFKYLPNIINVKSSDHSLVKHPHSIDIGCFGALRILKNHVFQAMCAMSAADILNKTLRFHITVDANADKANLNPVLKNLEELFKRSSHELICHPWMENDEFQGLVRKMDIGLQLSYTESFNIVAADFVNNDIPIIVSDAIDWMPDIFKTSTIDYEEATNKIVSIYKSRTLGHKKNVAFDSLVKYNRKAQQEWLDFII
jgi:hypothetical protein